MAVPLNDAAILQHIGRLPHARATFKQLVKELGAKSGGREALEQALDRLVERAELLELRNGHFVLARRSREFAVGRLMVHRDGFGFVVPEYTIEGIRGDVFVPPGEVRKAMHGDRVIVRLGRIAPDGRVDGEVLRILQRAHTTVVGEFRIRRAGCFVKPHDDRIQQWVQIPEGMELPPSGRSIDRVGVDPIEIQRVEDLDGLIVNVEIVDFGDEDDADPVGRIIEVLGRPDDFGIDVEITIRKFHIPHEFPPDVVEQAGRYSTAIPPEELKRRRDFRPLPVVTIDGETARDFDDAVWVDRLPSGNFALHVHIADVGYYVRPGSPIDREAARRGTSVYFPDRAVPMLPVELSTNLCSLRPQEDRLTLSVLLEIDHQGSIVSQEFCRGIIRSAERMTYTHVFQLLEGEDPELHARYAPLLERFRLMRELALILNRMRGRRGAIDFDLPEPLIEFDLEGEMIGIVRHPRNIAHRIVEEFMLAANEAVASHISSAALPSVYRVHESPDPKRVLEFEEAATQFGYSLGVGAALVKKFRQVTRTADGRKIQRDIVIPDERATIPSKRYQQLAAKLEGKPEERILTYLMLRSLRQARYSPDNLGHYALAATHYTHFTSPIRRYPDLMVHRILCALLDHREGPPQWGEDELRYLCEDCSRTERRADEAERELVEWKKAKFMIDRVGEEFGAMIISTTRFGFFVELENLFIEGLVPLDSLPGERFLFHENTRKVVGERSRREFSIGDRVRVILDRVDAVERKLQFSLVDEQPERKRKNRRREARRG